MQHTGVEESDDDLAQLDEEIRSLFEDTKYQRFYRRHKEQRAQQHREWQQSERGRAWRQAYNILRRERRKQDRALSEQQDVV